MLRQSIEEGSETNLFKFLLSCTILTGIAIFVSVYWLTDVITTLSPIAYLVCASIGILFPLTVFFPLFVKHTSLSEVKGYCKIKTDAYENAQARMACTPVPYFVLMQSYVVIYCLIVLLLDVHLLCSQQQCEIRSIGFIWSLTDSESWLWNIATMLELFLFLVPGFYLLSLASCVVFDEICNYRLDQVQGSIVVCAVITWCLCVIAVLVCHWCLLHKRLWLLAFPLTIGVIVNFFFVHRYKLTVFPLPRSPSSLFFLTCVLMELTFAVTCYTPLQPPLPGIQYDSQKVIVPSQSPSLIDCVKYNYSCVLCCDSCPSCPTVTIEEKCAQVDRNSHFDIMPANLVHFDYMLRGEGKLRGMDITRSIGTASCKNLATLFNMESYVTDGCTKAPENCCLDVFNEWFKNDPNKSYPLSWNGLIKALHDIQMNRLAWDIDVALDCMIR